VRVLPKKRQRAFVTFGDDIVFDLFVRSHGISMCSSRHRE
jgi:hypothetical protein